MPERFLINPLRSRRLARVLGLLASLTIAVGAAACTEDLGGGLACPALCQAQTNGFRDTIIDAVVLDTSIGGFPTFGLATNLLIATRGDTIQTSGVIRFDSLPTAFVPNLVGDTLSITAIDSVFLRVVIDSTGGRGVSQVNLLAYDVDSVGVPNPSAALVRSLFRPDRLIGSTPITPSAARDTVRIPLSRSAVLAKITGKSRLRIGLRLSGTTSSQIRIVAFSGGSGAPLLSFDPTTDTTYIPVGVPPKSSVLAVSAEQTLANTVYSVSNSTTPDAGLQTLQVGGFPSRRAYLRFLLPALIRDSSTVVRAELLLTQRQSFGVDQRDSITVVPMVSTATTRVTDVRRAMDLAAEGIFAGLDSIRLVPGDSTTRTLNVLTIVRNWGVLDSSVVRAIVFRSSNEGAEPAEARFYSSEAPAALRPRLRITFLRKVLGALP
jgi:hypothetical protein